ncbi:catalase [Cardiobacteriaceae bacterium TAE3-ERU3]|nr:catalase [Cardiobacteriaceae bacterium TAE3-ERU3]
MRMIRYSCLGLALFASATFANEPEHYTAQTIAEILTELNGDPNHPKSKVNHTKGWCATGEFVPVQDSELNVPLFNQEKIPVQIRYSLGGNNWSDKSKTRGMALRLQGNDEVWTQVMLSSPINFAKTVDDFGLFFKIRLPKDGKVDQELIQKVTEEIPSFRDFAEFRKTVGVTKSLTKTAFYSVHTFWFELKDGTKVAARWYWQPEKGVQDLSEEELANTSDNFLLKNSLQDLENGEASYTLYLTFANPEDKTDDTTALWQGEHHEIELGKLTITSYDDLSCDSEVYFPAQIPKGVSPPQDPLFDARNTAYAIKFGQRAGLPDEMPRDLEKEAQGEISH